MNVLFVTKSLVLRGGGAERVLVHVANGLHSRNHCVNVITFDKAGSGRPFYDLNPNIGMTGIGEIVKEGPTGVFGLCRAAKLISDAASRLSPDVIAAFMHSSYVPAAFGLLATRYPLIASEHIDAAHYAGRPAQAAAARIARELATAITVPSVQVQYEMPSHLRAKTTVLSNPIDLSAFASTRPAPSEPPYTILAAGRFMEQKNHLELIEAFSRIAERFPDWTLRIVGDGELRGQLEHRIAGLGLAGRVQLPGISSNMPAEYAAASFVVMPSLYESFGLVTAEALASARTVLGFAQCVGTAELISDGVNGILLPQSGDRIGQLADGMTRLMSDPALRDRLGANGPASVERFAVPQIVDGWEKLLYTVAHNRSPDGRAKQRGSRT